MGLGWRGDREKVLEQEEEGLWKREREREKLKGMREGGR